MIGKMKRMTSLLVLMTLLFFYVTFAPSITVESVIGSTFITVNPIADAYVYSEMPETNFGTDDNLNISSNSKFSYAYIMFDLSSIPEEANIISAKLNLYLASTGGDIYGLPADEIGAYFCTDSSWTEHEIAWNNKPSFASTPSDTWSFGLVYTYKNYKSWDVTDDLKKALPSERLSEAVKFTKKTKYGYARFESNEGSHKPELEVEYSIKPVHDVLFESVQDTGDTKNLGYMTLAEEAFFSPSEIPIVAGDYEVTYNGGYIFLRWETSGGVSVSRESDETTTLSVSGPGTLRAVGSGESIEYTYDDGAAEYSASKKSGQMIAVRFTPLLSDRLTTIRIYFSYLSYNVSKNEVDVHVLDANRKDVITPITLTPTSKGWLDVDLSAYGLSVTADDDFYIAVEWTEDYSPNIGEDKSQPDEMSWNYDGTSWNVEKNYDYSIRVVLGKVPSTITCWPSPSPLTIGSEITVSGSIDPPREGIEVTLTYVRPDEELVTRKMETTASGSYADVYAADILGSWSVYAYWAGDETCSEATSAQASFTVTKASSTISCEASSAAVTIGESFAITGSIKPPVPDAPVYLQSRMEGEEQWKDITSVRTDSDGSYSYTYTPTLVGEYEFRASWAGDAVHDLAESNVVTITATKEQSDISCSPSKSTIKEDESITIKGSVNPPLGGVTVTLIYSTPDDKTIKRTATTAEDGTYSDTYTPGEVGSWRIRASWDGDEEHFGAESSQASFEVAEEKVMPCIIATATYGSELSPEVDFLRGFRDLNILSTFSGRQFMNVFNAWYYSFSPTVATLIARSDALRVFMKALLYPLIWILYLASASYSLLSFNHELAVLASGLIASMLIGVAYFAPIVFILCLVKKVNIHKKSLWAQSLILALSVSGVATALITRWSGLMMASTTLLVLSTMSLATMFSVWYVKRLRYVTSKKLFR